MRFSAVVVSVLGALSLTACMADEEHSHRHPGHVPQATPPELPRLQSKLLSRLDTAKLARSSARMGDADPTGSIERVSGNRRIAQKVLLLGATGAEPAFLAAKSALDRIGVPYRTLIAANETVTDALLSDGISRCHFSGVIVATSSLGYVNPASGAWESAMAPAEWQSLADFEAACSARELTWYGWPGAEYGLAPAAGFDWTQSVDATLTAAGKAQFVRVRDTATIKYRHAAGYRATITNPATTTALVSDAGGVLVAAHNAADGRELMISTVDASPYVAHSLVLEYDFVRWVTRGMFVGKKRAYMTPQIDDLFLANDMWNDTAHVNDPTIQFRITGTDLTTFSNWQRDFQQRLPAGSTFDTWMAFNGVGTLQSEYSDTSLLAAALAAGSRLAWMNHTWDHENLDAATRAAARAEVTDNCRLASRLWLHRFNCNELVSPDVSGLGNANALGGMYDAGVRSVVSDASITEALRPSNPGNNPSFNVGRANPLDPRIYQVPRHPTSIFYDVATPATETDEYNTIYRNYYGRDLTYAEVLDKDSEFGLFYLLQGDIDPLMFHQANLKNYGGGRSLYADWVDTVANKYLAYFDAPILTLRQSAISAEMQARGKFNACNVTATIIEGTPKTLELRTTAGCVVPVTGVAASSHGAVETYAGEPTTSITMGANQVRLIPLSTGSAPFPR
jgi:hypothetical protein